MRTVLRPTFRPFYLRLLGLCLCLCLALHLAEPVGGMRGVEKYVRKCVEFTIALIELELKNCAQDCCWMGMYGLIRSTGFARMRPFNRQNVL